MKTKIQALAKAYEAELRDIRRHLHAHPELSTEEFETADYICNKLTEYGIPFNKGIAVTGIVAHIKGLNPDADCIALRADMDALPINEAGNKTYRSQVEGVMHACGHDAHMACLLGAAKILHELRNEFEGTVKLIFQPSEEDFRSGANIMIAEGALENPRPSAIFGLHVLPEMPTGKIGMKSGPYMASTDEIYITLKGKGGHGATPDQNIDTVLMTAQTLVSLQQIVSRCAPPYVPTVLSFGKMQANGRTNIIPDTGILEGTIRTFNEKWRAQAHQKIKHVASGVAASMGGTAEVHIEHGYPAVFNNLELTEQTRKQAIEFMGDANLVEELELRMTAEDFSYFAQEIPGCFFRLGTGGEGCNHNLHTAEFDLDEAALEIGAGLMAHLAVAHLKKKL